ncbi:hypothetical protein EC973_008672 [Apophysomyces ossiformis]|uniref:F-box domain-containing protein n=1 Tax=Apophysomyces ossiformis TaxID=679940 RepID=A0A8H7EQ45_9FUNG|nr:hypothetical protein EC973_008672 [Apophysomyces ossiformis]
MDFGAFLDDLSPPSTPPESVCRPVKRLQWIYTDFPLDEDLSSSTSQRNYMAKVKNTFQQLTTQQKRFFLSEILSCCDNHLLAFINTLIQPKLKIDFLKQLPLELSLHVLSFIDDPRTLANASRVSTTWNALVKDEELWKELYQKHHGPLLELRPISYRDLYRRKHNIETAWIKGTGRTVSCPNEIGTGLVTSLQIDNDFTVVGCDNKRIEVFDSQSGRHIRTLRGHDGGVWALEFVKTTQGQHVLVSGGCDREARVWNLNSGKLRHVLRGHSSTIRCLKMRDEKVVVTGSRDATLRIWDIESGTLKHLCVGHRASVRCLDVHDSRVASGSYDTTARLWDTDTGECLHVFDGHHSQIYTIAFDGQHVITGSLDTNIRIWSAQYGHCIANLRGHTSLVGHLQLHRSLPILVSGGSDGCLRVWDLNTFECKHRISAHDNSVTCLQVDEKRILTGGSDGRVKLWDIETGTLIRSFTQPGRTVWKLQLNPTKAVVVLQRRVEPDLDFLQTAIELHDFDTT